MTATLILLSISVKRGERASLRGLRSCLGKSGGHSGESEDQSEGGEYELRWAEVQDKES